MRPDLPAALWEELRRAYSAPGRAYHNLAHLDDVLHHYDSVRWEHPVEALVALAYHDAVYDPGAGDNEESSAQLARSAVERWLPGLDTRRVMREIELTKAHGSLSSTDVDADEAQVLDCDMAILGASPDAFDSYDRGIAAEYAALPSEAFRAGRGAFLERLLSSDRIFLSEAFHRRFDTQARKNLRRALDRLERATDSEACGNRDAIS
jgi:predicted metal-dependent HD superfamily phosphohydrolase